MSSTELDRKAAVARLVASGHMTREHPGSYADDVADDEGLAALPEYDVEQIIAALPRLLELQFDEDDDGCFVLLKDGGVGGSESITTLRLGEHPPATTESLIETIQAHYMGQIDVAAMDEADDIFDAIADS